MRELSSLVDDWERRVRPFTISSFNNRPSADDVERAARHNYWCWKCERIPAFPGDVYCLACGYYWDEYAARPTDWRYIWVVPLLTVPKILTSMFFWAFLATLFLILYTPKPFR